MAGLASCGKGSSPQTIVTLTYDDTLADTYEARPILFEEGLHGTFYVNSGRIGQEGFMTLAELQQLAQDGSEIASHTVLHADLLGLDATEQKREICDDRVALLGLGFDVQSFAYPYSADDQVSRQVAVN